MIKINNIENEEIKKGSKTTESHFDDEWHRKVMTKIQEEKSKQKERDLTQVSELTEKLNKPDINEFIKNEKHHWSTEMDITYKLIMWWYNRDEIMNSSLDVNIKNELKKKKEEVVKKYFLPNSFRFKDENDIDQKFLKIFIDVQKNWESYHDIIKKEPLKRPITLEDINNWISNLDNPANNYSINLNWEILPDLDWHNSSEVFRDLNTHENESVLQFVMYH